ncbi:SAM-dependent methyltransferase [Actinomadura parmotrematis]|uniref:SAM-dependent methyltransferase n=1 Tax=Actinomadura parmotrematis TaxID=2864039 RepID=A0ABS7FMW2_9ACTN|nr:SAM-dependent methyltransferase [Actinomadura parmotrematis]MBW8481716.1 SAM-dependent methyltransferase [Actinomadura parmotrematis]
MTSGAAVRVRRCGGGPSGMLERGASAARICNYFLGGKDHYLADRVAGERMLEAAPTIARAARANRVFLEDAVRHLARTGIRQFLDVGCGLPAHDSVADVARRVALGCRVAYVDNDPVVTAHARALLATGQGTVAYGGDLRDPGRMLQHPELLRVIDPERPIGVLLLGVLPFLRDEEGPGGIVEELVDLLPDGSRVVVSHIERTPEVEEAAAVYAEAGITFRPRGRAELAGMLHGLQDVRGAVDDGLPLLGFAGRVRRL